MSYDSLSAAEQRRLDGVQRATTDPAYIADELAACRAALRDIRGVLDDYSESRIDALVAVGKIGLRLYTEPSS